MSAAACSAERRRRERAGGGAGGRVRAGVVAELARRVAAASTPANASGTRAAGPIVASGAR